MIVKFYKQINLNSFMNSGCEPLLFPPFYISNIKNRCKSGQFYKTDRMSDVRFEVPRFHCIKLNYVSHLFFTPIFKISNLLNNMSPFYRKVFGMKDSGTVSNSFVLPSNSWTFVSLRYDAQGKI